MGKPASPPARSLKARAIRLLAQREQSRVELERKLLPHARLLEAGDLANDPTADPTADPIADHTADHTGGPAAPARSAERRLRDLLDWLEANGYLSNERFVESRVQARAARYGNLRIRQELAQHRLALPPEVASSLLDSELARARALCQARPSARPPDVRERNRQFRFLTGRGFSPEVVYRLMREIQTAGRKAGTADHQAEIED